MLVADKADELFGVSSNFHSPSELCDIEFETVPQKVLQNFDIDVDCNLSPGEDFLHELSHDLEIPMLLEESQHLKENFMESSALLDNFDEAWGVFNENSCSGLAAIKEEIDEIKCEPTSPSMSPMGQYVHNDNKILLETPPISPDNFTASSEGTCSPPNSPLYSNCAEITFKKSHAVFDNDSKPVVTRICNSAGAAILPHCSVSDIKDKKRIFVCSGSQEPLLMKNFIQNSINEEREKFSKISNNSSLVYGDKNVKNVRNCNNISVVQIQPLKVMPGADTIKGTRNNVNSVNNCKSKLIKIENVCSLNALSQNKKHNNDEETNNTIISSIKIEPIIPPSVRQEIQMRVLKRQQRMIKNRESACLSRKKKKEYVSSLEARISDLEKENGRLLKENTILRERVSELESNTIIRSNNKFNIFQSSSFKKSSILLGVILFLSVNLGSFSLLKRAVPELSEFKSVTNSRHHSRFLLWANLEDSPVDEPFVDKISTMFSEEKDRSSPPSPNPFTCPLFINQSESLRLNSELRRWIGLDELGIDNHNDIEDIYNDTDIVSNYSHRGSSSYQKNNFNDGKVKFKQEEKKLKELMLPSSKPKPPLAHSSGDLKRKRKKRRNKSHEVNLLGAEKMEQGGGLLNAIKRREDTFYVVSFSGDHLLLPATVLNNTLRPKMSLLMPSLLLNGSINMAQPFTMMQIDCEVLDTRVVELKEADIPIRLRTTSFFTSASRKDQPPLADSHVETVYSQQQNITSANGPSFLNRQTTYRPYFMRSNTVRDYYNNSDHLPTTGISDIDVKRFHINRKSSFAYLNEKTLVHKNRFP